MTSVRLPEAELRRVLDATGRCSEVDGGTTAVTDVLDAIRGLVPCDVIFWNWFTLEPALVEHALVAASTSRAPSRAPLGPWLEHLPEHPIMSGRYGPVTAVSDVLRGRDLEASWLYQEALVPAGVRYEIGLELSHGEDEMSAVVLSRGPGRDFSERDRLILRLLRPHVDAALRRAQVRAPHLTPRERQVLTLVRDGLTNAQVARRLGIGEATVAKHLEHVYSRLGARSRTHAVTLAADVLARPS
jgi:DNA-binding CsgD family transcriptional regulator